MIKKVLLFTGCFIPWLVSYIFPLDYDYYKEIKLPFFAPPQVFYPIAWTTVYILIAITVYQIVYSHALKDIPKSYKKTLLINYLFNQSYTLVFFGLQKPFLGVLSTLGTFLSTLFLKEETSLINSKISKLLVPYILLSLFATILSLSIYLLNAI
ncbi:MAG: tryptophan-rich sensory protein [Bacilli bacterium]|nr:tryptophan-rich sensory protein [Bacilli bacterium]